MENKNTIKHLVELMEKAGESPHYIIGWLSGMIDASANGFPIEGYTMQDEINNGIKFYSDKVLLQGRMAAIQKVANSANLEDLYA